VRVLALTNLYPTPAQPHRAPFNRHQLRLLAERHPVRVIAPIAWTDEARALFGGKARSRRAVRDGLTVDHPIYWYPPHVGRAWYGHCFARSVGGAFRRVVREFRPDVVFAPWAYPDGWAAVRLGHAAGLPVVVQVHGSDVRLLDAYPARRGPTADALARADGVVAVSRDLAERVAALGGAPEKVRVIRDGVDATVFRPGPKAEARDRVGLTTGDPVVLFVGNLVPVKAVDVLLAAVARMAADGVRVRLVLAGAGPLRDKLDAQARGLGLSDRVRFLGARPQEELADWYRAADVFVLPSHSEGTPNVLLEASACWTPWVATQVGGIPDIAELGASRLVPPGDASALAEAIAQTLVEPPSRPAAPTKLRAEAVAELADYLEEVVGRTQAQTRTSSNETVLLPSPVRADPPLSDAQPVR
jgi:glycosyltransferase involved in cell wall biosynthesis